MRLAFVSTTLKNILLAQNRKQLPSYYIMLYCRYSQFEFVPVAAELRGCQQAHRSQGRVLEVSPHLHDHGPLYQNQCL